MARKIKFKITVSTEDHRDEAEANIASRLATALHLQFGEGQYQIKTHKGWYEYGANEVKFIPKEG